MIKKCFFIFLIITMISCSPNAKEQSEEPGTGEPSNVFSSSVDTFINEILGSGENTIRGFNLGDSIFKIRETEKLEMFDETPDMLSYTFETTGFDVVDVLYSFDSENLLTDVQLDIYLSEDSISNEISQGLNTYFTQKYGSPIENLEPKVWAINKSQKVILKNITSKLDRGLQVNFRKED